MSQQFFKKSIIVFWFVWWIIALWTDIVGTLAHIGHINASWAPDSNYPFLIKSLQMYHVPEFLPIFLYSGILLLSTTSTVLFFLAIINLNKPPEIWLAKARSAFVFSIGFWLLFFIADQIVMNYDLEQNHMVQGGFELLSFLALYLLPND